MTAELEEVDNKSEKEIEVEKDKDSPKEEEAPKNGGGDVKKIDDDDEKPATDEKPTENDKEEKQEEEEAEPVVVKKKLPSLFQRLFRRGNNAAKQLDPEAGTELLAKDGKVEIKGEEDGKNEKNDSGTDVTVAVTDDNEANDKSNVKVYGDSKKMPAWKRIVYSMVAIIIALVIVTVVSIYSTSGHTSRGPLGEPLAITDCGLVKGFKENDIYVFKGIPYALPPIGELRWKPPMQASSFNDCWTGTYEAFNSSAICFQKPISGHNLEMSEDCLYLDIITPSLSPPVPRPVVVYIPADNPLQGHSASDIKWRPTTALADAQDVTFVTINYRTNVFGFMVLDLLTDRMRPPTSGNYGVMDMIAALKWVQRNIRNFGGDPEKVAISPRFHVAISPEIEGLMVAQFKASIATVTVLAHGGAATAGLALLSSKKSDGLFSQMWLTAPSARFSNMTLEEVGASNAVFLRKLDCDTVECLYNKTSEEILAAMPGFWASNWSEDLPSSEEEHSAIMTVIDGNVLTDTPYNMWKAGEIQKVPVVIGSAAQESGASTLVPDTDKWSWADFTDYVNEKLKTIGDNITASALQFYIQNSSTPQQQYHTMVSDIRTICPLEVLSDALGEALQSNSYWYLVDYKPSVPIQFSNDSLPVRLSIHGIDIAAIFGLLDNYINPMSSSDTKFEKNMQDLFFSFVKYGRPEINREILMSSTFINIIGDVVRSKMTPYENCHWNNDVFYPTYAKMN